MLRGYSFHPRRIGTYGALVLAAAACVALGNWQARRADEKRAAALQVEEALRGPALELAPGRLDARALAHKHVAARGGFDAAHTVLLANRLRQGRPGYEVVTPLRLGASAWHVLVNRGWIAAPDSPGTAPAIPTPGGEQRIEGLALERLPHALQAGAPSSGRVRQNLDIDAFAAETGLRLEPIVIEQHSEAPDGLARDWPRADLGIERNESYALQWYSFAALAIVLVVVLSLRRDAAR
jgi:surfeit locus 1 family protein